MLVGVGEGSRVRVASELDGVGLVGSSGVGGVGLFVDVKPGNDVPGGLLVKNGREEVVVLEEGLPLPEVVGVALG